MKTLTKIMMGTALALGLGCIPDSLISKRIESIELPRSCAEVASIERSALHQSWQYNYDVSCKEIDGKYRLYTCEYNSSRKKENSCKPEMTFEHQEINKP